MFLIRLDYDNNSEDVRFIYGGDELQEKMKIPACYEYFLNRCDTYENNIFNTFCDFLSVNFKEVSEQFNQYLQDLKNIFDGHAFVGGNQAEIEMNIFNQLKKASILLAEPHTIYVHEKSIVDGHCYQRSSNLIAKWTALQQFALEYIHNKKLHDVQKFNAFIGSYLFSTVPLPQCDESMFEKMTHRDSFEHIYDLSGEERLGCFLKQLQENYSNQVIFACENGLDIAIASLYQIILKDLPIAQCENCGKYFVPLNRSDTKYCDRQSPQDTGMTCKKYGSERLWYDKLMQNEPFKEARKIYMAKQMLAKRNPDIEMHKANFERYKVEYKQWKSDFKSGMCTEIEFIEWLKQAKQEKI